MLSHLSISNFALVDALSLDFSSGMTVITGETGAGKSIMLDALGLTLGDRADVGLIGPASEKAEITASFEIDDIPEAKAWLEERELGAEECLLRRVISKDGRSKGFINGSPSTIADMKALGEYLIDIHSQHEHQSLLKKATHQRLLDEFAGGISLASEVRRLHGDHKNHQEALADLIATNEEQSARLQLLNYQAEELAKLALKPGEFEALEEEQKRLAGAEKVLSECDQVVQLCSNEDGQGALDQLSKSCQIIQQLDLKDLSPITDLLENAKIQLSEAVHDLERFCDDFEMNPARLNEVEERISAVFEICRKHRIEPSEIPELESDITQELDRLGNLDQEIQAREKLVEETRAAYFSVANKLTALRQKAAKKLSTAITGQLKDLGMGGASFSVSLNEQPSVPHADGLEDVEFLISTNPGQTPRSINKIASGGELSRISLAIQVVTADTSKVPTLVFDEVDVGIGGATAEVVGSLLRQLGQKAQIVCVTHLAQVAAQGHEHLRVSKSGKKKANTDIVQLGDDEKVEEIARMLGGLELTDQSLAHAAEMFSTAQA